jgi:AraC family transcriptional regulator, transcriptional activator of the genes for pyochelin and ferripyochelin receptors
MTVSIDRLKIPNSERPLAARKPDMTRDTSRAAEGLLRTVLAGTGHSLADVFANLEFTPHVQRVWRHAKRGLLSARASLASAEGEGYWELTRIRDEIYLVVADYAYKDRRVEIVPGDDLIQFAFKISGDMTLETEGSNPLRWNQPSLLIWAQPKGVDVTEWTASSAHERYVTISVRPDFLKELLSTSSVELSERLQAFISSGRKQVSYLQLPMSPMMFEAATKLIDNPFTGACGLIFTEALAIELLCCAAESFCSRTDAPSEEYSEHKLRRLYAARNILMQQFTPPPTIAKLARLVGMGESTLTKGFKYAFGQTISDFSLRCRMQRAMRLIGERGWSVSRASEEVGYSHATSFTTAFRRHFGIRPIDLRCVQLPRWPTVPRRSSVPGMASNSLRQQTLSSTNDKATRHLGPEEMIADDREWIETTLASTRD